MSKKDEKEKPKYKLGSQDGELVAMSNSAHKEREGDSTALIIPGQAATVVLPVGIDVGDEDFATPQEEEAPTLPYISIRQKNHKDGKDAEIEWELGWWKVATPPGQRVNDIESLRLTVLFFKRARTYFREGDEKPYCKSIDGDVGMLMTEETDNGKCATCKYSKFVVQKEGQKPKPACAEGRNLYAIVEGIGPAIIRLGVSSIKPWRAFDNLVGTKRIDFNGVVKRVPWFFSIVELGTVRVDRTGLDPYWVVEPQWDGFHKDKATLDILRERMGQSETYDETAWKVDLGTEDVTGKTSSEEVKSDDDLPFSLPPSVGRRSAGAVTG